MFKQISNAFLSLFMEKTARRKLAKMRDGRKADPSQITSVGSRDVTGRPMTQERSELIQNALEVRRNTAKVLDDLKAKKKQYSTAVEKMGKKIVE